MSLIVVESDRAVIHSLGFWRFCDGHHFSGDILLFVGLVVLLIVSRSQPQPIAIASEYGQQTDRERTYRGDQIPCNQIGHIYRKLNHI